MRLNEVRQKLDAVEQITKPDGISSDDMFFSCLIWFGREICNVIEKEGETLHPEALQKLENGTNILLAKALEKHEMAAP